MNELLQIGQKLNTARPGESCEVKKYIGSGGQGEVYQADWRGESHALKWYFRHTATQEQRQALEKLVNDYPRPSDAFLWPLAIVLTTSGYGYLMPLRPTRFKGLTDLVAGRLDPTFRVLANFGLGLIDGFHKLHARGLCYRDVSFGNAFFDPQTGDALICDNDNVTYNGTPIASVLGTPDFMAPEIVRQEVYPDCQTDLYSLSVLLFYIFHIQHPLIGRRILTIHSWDLSARKKLLGNEPLFIFDPKDKSNEAVPASEDPLKEAGANALTYWNIYPQFLRDAFIRSFTSGLTDPNNGRVTLGEWRKLLSSLGDSIFYCSSCTKENFYDHEALQTTTNATQSCWNCKKELRLPFRICIGRSIILLPHDAKLYPHHIQQSEDYDFSEAVAAEVTKHPTQPNTWGLKNCTSSKWVATTSNGEPKDVEPGQSVKLANETKVNFGKMEGEIRY